MTTKQKVLISLIGHQPLPNLLVIRHLRPDQTVFLTSGNNTQLAERKRNLIKLCKRDTAILEHQKVVDPWDLLNTHANLNDIIFDNELENAELLFDVTGGTKAMSLGLMSAAVTYAKQGRDVKLLYLESDGAVPMLRYYSVDEQATVAHDAASVEEVRIPLTIEDFWIAYLGQRPRVRERDPNAKGSLFEEDLEREFRHLQEKGLIDEILTTVLPPSTGELDFVLRKGSRFAIVECKTGKVATELTGVYSLNHWASDKYLGTYTGKVLAVTQVYPKDTSEVAAAHDVLVLELPGWSAESRSLEKHRDTIRAKIRELFKL